MKQLLTRPMVEEDLAQILAIHMASFPGFFLTFLGQDFLRLFYRNVFTAPGGVVIVAYCDGTLEGFAAGVTHQSGFYEDLIRHHKWAFAGAALRALVQRPMIALRLLRALKRPSDAQQAASEACLMSIAVRPEAQGKGLGQKLVNSFCEALAARGVHSVCLTAYRDHNDRVNRFYEQLGFQLSRELAIPQGQVMNEWLKSWK